MLTLSLIPLAIAAVLLAYLAWPLLGARLQKRRDADVLTGQRLPHHRAF